MKFAQPESPKGDENKSHTNNKVIGRRNVMLLALCLFASVFLFVAPVSALDTNTTVDWTSLGEMISGAATMFPSITTLIMAVVPILILLVIVGFVTGLFDSIIQAVKNAISFLH